MKENKNLDKLFQEKFKSLDFQPQEIVWKNIEEQLKEKKKKRIIPFWWKISGIAACLVLGVGIYSILNTTNFNTGKIENSVVDSNEKNIPIEKNNIIKPVKAEQINNDALVIENDNLKNSSEQSNKIEKSTNASIVNSNTKSVENNLNKSRNLLVNRKNNNAKNNSILTSKRQSIAGVNFKEDKNSQLVTKENVHSSESNNSSLINKTVFENNKISNNLNNSTNTEKTISENDVIAQNEDITNKKENKNTNQLLVKELDPIQKDIKKIDTTSIASVVPNAMEELLNEKEKKTIKEPKLNRWQLSSNVAPIYFSSASNGSPLDSKFNDNTKQFNTNIGYGIGVKYAINKKIKIRTGVNSLVADYNTNDVVVYQNVNASRIQHVDPNLRGSLMQVENKTEQTILTLEGNGTLLTKFDSSLNQKIGYIEIPLELSYKIVDKKFGVEVIGGVSSLFLNQNEVSVITAGTEMSIGKANNLNSIHFSGNLGLGLKYNIWKKIEAHVEPIFKYQVNTFNNETGNFKPYIFGIYSGLSYTF